MLTMNEYRVLMEDRPEKAAPDDVNYRESEGKQRCGNCLHFYERRLDDFGVCELIRPEDDGPIKPEMVCDFWTTNGQDFPLRPRIR